MGLCSKLFVLAAGAVVVFSVGLKLLIQSETGRWEVPPGSQEGKVAVVTGANSGLGLETSRELAAAGAVVVLACRTDAKCEAAKSDIRRTVPDAVLEHQVLDLADQVSIRAFAADFLLRHDRLDLLINNAAVMATPYATVLWTGAGGVVSAIEKQFATNHLGPFMLTGLLQVVLEKTPGARVINHSSSASDGCPATDLTPYAQVAEKDFSSWTTYGCSKRANRFFTWSLADRLKGATSIACHPGYAATNLQHRATGVQASFLPTWLFEAMAKTGNFFFAQSPEMGAQPQLFAAVDPDLKGGEVVGPRFFMAGSPVLETSVPRQIGLFDKTHATQAELDALWTLSEKLSGVTYAAA